MVTYGGGRCTGLLPEAKCLELLGTDLHCKYYIIHSSIKLESKASVLMVNCYLCSSCWEATMVCVVCCLTETS